MKSNIITNSTWNPCDNKSDQTSIQVNPPDNITCYELWNRIFDLRMKIYEFFNPILTNQIGERLCPYCRAFALDHRAYVMKNHEKNLGIDISF